MATMESVQADLGVSYARNPARGTDVIFASVAISLGLTARSAMVKVPPPSHMTHTYSKVTHYGAGVSGVGTEAIWDVYGFGGKCLQPVKGVVPP